MDHSNELFMCFAHFTLMFFALSYGFVKPLKHPLSAKYRYIWQIIYAYTSGIYIYGISFLLPVAF